MSGKTKTLVSRTRRRFVKRASMFAMALAMPVVWTRRLSAQSFSGQELNMLTWPGWGDPYVTKAFEEKTGAKIKVKEYIGGEAMLANLSQVPPGTYDIILADHEYVSQLKDANQITALDPSQFPFDQYWEELRRFEPHWFGEEMYAVLTSFGYIGIAYNTKHLTREEVDSYKVLWDPKVKGKVGWFDWYLPNMGCLSLYDGNRPPYDISDEAFTKLQETLMSLRPQTGGFLGMAELFSSLSNEQVWTSAGVGDWVTQLLQNQGHAVDTVVPKEGGLMWSDSWTIAKASSKPELAYAWIRYIASPEGQILAATLPAFSRNIPNKEGWKLLREQKPEWAKRLRHHFDEPNVIDEYKAGKIFARALPVQQTIEVWNEAWTEFKNA